MLTRISRFFYLSLPGWLVWLFLLLQISFAGFIMPRLEKWITPVGSQIRILDLSFGFSPEEAYQTLEAYTQLGRQRYMLAELIADTVYPLVYAGFLMLLLTALLKGIFPEDSKWRLLNLFPLLTIAADYSENIGIITMLAGFPSRLDGAALWASTAGMIKWAGVAITAGMAVVALFWRLICRILNKN